jgi:hypothetical protein
MGFFGLTQQFRDFTIDREVAIISTMFAVFLQIVKVAAEANKKK